MSMDFEKMSELATKLTGEIDDAIHLYADLGFPLELTLAMLTAVTAKVIANDPTFAGRQRLIDVHVGRLPQAVDDFVAAFAEAEKATAP